MIHSLTKLIAAIAVLVVLFGGARFALERGVFREEGLGFSREETASQASSGAITANKETQTGVTAEETKDESATGFGPESPSEPTTSTPGPLVVPLKNAPPTVRAVTQLDHITIMAFTNAERTKVGLPPLSYNIRLAAMAEGKAVDMREQGYFAHESPSGVGVGDLARMYGYEFLSVGENLALGEFDSNSELVQGWMNSPGHRANILGDSYTEIGVSVLRGSYQGREVWFAVQEFGKPRSACPYPDEALRKSVEEYQSQIEALEVTLYKLKEEIVTPGITSELYNEKVILHNATVELHRTLVATAEAEIDRYNKEVNVFNACVGEE